MRPVAFAAITLLACVGTACAKARIEDRAKDRGCTPVDVARFESMFGLRQGQYRSDPRFAVTIHYLGTVIVRGTCNVRLRLAD
jgi:hypothetical protein